MATEIGTLVVDMRADVAHLRTDVAEGNRIFGRGMREMEEAARHVQSQMSWVMGSQIVHSFDLLARRGAEAFGAIKRSAIDTADDLNKLSQKTGFTVEALSGLKYAAELSDVGIEGLQKSLKGLSQNMETAKSGNKEAIALFKSLGVTVDSSDEALLALADRFAVMPDGFQKTALAEDMVELDRAALKDFLGGFIEKIVLDPATRAGSIRYRIGASGVKVASPRGFEPRLPP